MHSLRRYALLLVLLALVGSRSGGAQTSDAFTPTPGEFLSTIPYGDYIQFDRQAPSGTVHDIREYGAIGDGKTVNTEAINRAIQAAHDAGGGVVRVDGGDFVSGTVVLKSNVTLYISKDAVLRASRHRADYDPMHFIYCENSHNVRIEGPGKIAGEGDAWWEAPRVIPPVTPPEPFNLAETMRIHGHAKRKKLTNRPSPMIRLRESADAEVRNVVIENSPGWTLSLDLCDRVTISNVVINNNYHGGNTDGIDVVGSSDVDISKCFISTGDDGIVLKNGFAGEQSRPMSHIRITGCAIRSSANCIKIGTETWSDIRDVQITDCEVFTEEIWPWSLSGVSIESVDGSKVRDITVKNITARNVMAPVFIRLGNRNRWKDKDRAGAIENVRISGVTARNVESPTIVTGIPGLYIRNVVLEDFDITYHDGPEQLTIQSPVPELEDGYPEFNNFGDLPAYALYARHVDGLVVRRFHVVPRTVNQRVPFVFDDVLRLEAVTTD